MRAVLAIILLALPAAAYGDGAATELSAGATAQSAQNPPTRWVADKLGAFYEPTDSWQLRLDVTGTRAYKATKSSDFTDPTDILLANLGIEFDPDASWSFRLVGGYSPSSTMTSPTTVQVDTMRGTVDATAQLASTSGSKSAAAWVGYDTANDSDFETSVLVTATVNRFDILQQITSVTDKTGDMISVQQIKDFCAAHMCSPQLVGALAAQPATLGQLAIEAGVTETLWRDTDVGLTAAYYAYDKDPTQVGYVSVGTIGRTASFGGGAPIAPLLFTVMPNAIHRWGDFMVLASFTYGQYVDREGYDLTPALRLQYKLKFDGGSRLKLWMKLAGSRDIVQSSKVSSGQAALGAQYSW